MSDRGHDDERDLEPADAEALAEALRASEERYRTFVAQSTEGIWRFELERPVAVGTPPDVQIDCFYADGTLAECNDAMARMYGFSSAGELTGARLGDLLVRDDPRNAEYLRAFIASGYRLENVESHERDRNGQPRVFQNSLVGIVEDGKLVRAWGTQRDVTAAVEAREAALAAIEARDTFLSIASHELKTPLTALGLRLAAFERGLDGPNGDVAAMRRQVKRLADLVEDLLDVSRLTLGRLVLHPEDVELSALAREVVARIEAESARAGSTLELRAESPVRGHWDRLRLEQVLTNLLSNAIKYGAGRPIRVEVKEADSVAVLAVQDEGIGISTEALERIFDKFARAVSERHYGGLGLGLFVGRQIVEAMGGTVQVTSSPGKGARFEVRLPR